jgi:CDP-4-dehydro-6-deoxyglucose reductase
MAAEITIKPSNHRFDCEADETVLAGALRANLLIPYGCSNGACGSCKGRVLEGRIDYGSYQPGALSDEERARGEALFCVARPLTDLAIEVREVRRAGELVVKKLPVRIEAIDALTPDIVRVMLKLPANERLQFLAGQYVDILLKDGRRRSFSLANAPHADELLELHIRHLPGGAFTDWLFGEARGREILRIEGPHGGFYLREESAKPMVLIAGGTGFAPIKALIEHAIHNQCARSIALYRGARRPQELYLPELAERWRTELGERFSHVPVVSDALPEDAWSGRGGLVHQAVMEDIPDLSGYQVYACGAPAMIEAARQDLVSRCGLPPEEFFADAFTIAAAAKANSAASPEASPS